MRSLLLALLIVGFAGTARAQGGIDESSYEAEDFEEQEEGVLFDYPRTGLMYRRNLYMDGDNVTFVPNYPTSYNDTRDIRGWKIFVSHWEQDPPSFINVYIRDDSPYHYSKASIDLKVSIGHYDRAHNLVVASEVSRQGIPITNGLNRIPVNIHNYKGDIVQVKLTGVQQTIPYQPIEVVE